MYAYEYINSLFVIHYVAELEYKFQSVFLRRSSKINNIAGIVPGYKMMDDASNY